MRLMKGERKKDPADRTLFILSPEKWAQLEAALGEPARDLPRLKALLQSPGFFDTLEILSDQDFSKSLVKSIHQEKEGMTRPSAEVRKRLGIDKESLATRRQMTMAAVMETPLGRLESFLDLIAEEELTDARIRGAQDVLGMCWPVTSFLQFPEFGDGPGTAEGRSLLAEWKRRRLPDA